MTDTSKYKFNHSMLRVKDPKVSVPFYENNFGMKLINKLDFPEAKFSLYFLAFDSPKATSSGKTLTDREGVLELTHNYGSEDDPNFSVSSGNAEPNRGFGHIAISVDHIETACERLDQNGVAWQKKLTDGRMKHIAFAKDPDGYWVEIIEIPSSPGSADTTDLQTYRFNHTMIRVKDAEKSLNFYQSVMGMSLLRTHESPENKFNLYFLGYRHGDEPAADAADTSKGNPIAYREGLLELTWNYGTEKEEKFKYSNGNESDPQGFGHICVSVDDLNAACSRFEDFKVNWKKRLTDGRMKTIAFVLDPDNYWIEILQNEGIKAHAN
jgi:lactoylglutathione lyase